MAIGRKKALERLMELTPRVEEHLVKIAAMPEDPSFSHWVHELKNWLRQMESAASKVGKRTGADWSKRIETWRHRLGE
jgi:hypothetical protein